MRLLNTILILLFTVSQTISQIIRVNPVFPKQDEPVTIIFDAKEIPSGAMLGVNKVYMHSSIGTNPDEFQWTGSYTVGNWGQNDGVGEMTSIGNDEWKISLLPDQYYNIPMNVTAYNLAMVFRNEDGSAEGKDVDGSDLFYPLFGSGLAARIVTPPTNPFFFAEINDTVSIYAASSDSANMDLSVNGASVKQVNGDSLTYEFIPLIPGVAAISLLNVTATDTATDTISIFVSNMVTIQDPPSGTTPGANIINDSTVILALVAPNKSNIVAYGSFNNWQLDSDNQMNLSTDGDLWWLEISGLDKDEEYLYQYIIDGQLTVADPYTEKILDPDDDPFIPDATYPDLTPYPSSYASGNVSTFIIDEAEYIWTNDTFNKPVKENLVIYELLIRDFLTARNYSTLIDTLDYIEHLGVNAIELMPVNEFEGNESWGYNPSFYFAVDKYYGTKNDLKRFVDECHSRGIAVILDVVLNHSFGQSPMVQMYWAGNTVSADNPWYNPIAKHDFNVGFDFNHESPYTIKFVDDVIKFWIEEFKVDGYRFDLSKGFTQNNTLGDIGAWGNYDQSRVDLWKKICDTIWSLDPDFYVMMEHFADNSEESDLSDYGMMLWGNTNFASAEATMGFVSTSDLKAMDYKDRNWNDPHLISFAESHDEERVMYKNLTFGNSQGQYSTRDLNTALARVEALATILFSIPGPKLMWMFGELGYDVSIDDPCRVCNKPIRWNYLENINRKRLYEVYSALINLRLSQETFTTDNYVFKSSGPIKRVQLFHPNMDVVATANFDVESRSNPATFPYTGTWYEFFSGDSLEVNSTDYDLEFLPGQYYLFTSKKLETPQIPVGIGRISKLNDVAVYPNPTQDQFFVNISISETAEVNIVLLDILGNEIERKEELLNKGIHRLNFQNTGKLSAGTYLVKVETGNNFVTQRIIVTN